MSMMRRPIAGLLVVFLFVSCGLLTKPQEARVVMREPAPEDYGDNLRYYYHSEGIKASLVNDDSQRAVALLRKAIEVDSTYAPAYFEISNILLESDPEEALTYMDKASRLDTANLTYRGYLARNYIFAGQYDDALDIYASLIGKDPHNALNYRMLALLYGYTNQPFTAISILDSAELKLGRIEELSSYKRQLLISTGLHDKAVEESKLLINEHPYNDENYLILAELYASQGKDSLAIENYRTAMQIDSTNVSTLLSVAEYYNSRGNNRNYLSFLRRVFALNGIPLEAKADMFARLTSDVSYYRNNFFAIDGLASTLFIKHPDNFKVVDLYATHLIRSGEIQQALSVYKSHLENFPDELEPYFIIVDIESYLQRPDSVARYSDMAIKRFPDNIDLYLKKGYALSGAGKEKEALGVLRQAYRKAGDDTVKSMTLGVIGDFYHTQGKNSKAYREYRKALKLNPDNAGVLNNYAYFMGEENKNLDKALEMSQKSNLLTPRNSTFLDTQAWILYKLGRYEEAKKLMMQAISLDLSDSPVLLVHYGDILYGLQDYMMAKVYWKRALDKGYDAGEIEERLTWPEK